MKRTKLATAADAAAPGAVEVVCDGTLCRLEVWGDAEWGALPEGRRPAVRERVPGLGWVGAVPMVALN